MTRRPRLEWQAPTRTAAMPDDEGLREEITRVVGGRIGKGHKCSMIVDALLPVVERHAAEELRGRTDGVRRWASICDPGPFRDGLTAAADALDGES